MGPIEAFQDGNRDGYRRGFRMGYQSTNRGYIRFRWGSVELSKWLEKCSEP